MKGNNMENGSIEDGMMMIVAGVAFIAGVAFTITVAIAFWLN